MAVPPTPGTGQQTTWAQRAENATFAPAAITVTAGDIITAYVTTEDANYSATIADSQGNSYTLKQDVNVASFARVQIWTAIANASGSVTITFTRDNTVANKWCGGVVRGWSNHGGIGTSNKANNASGTPTVSLTTSDDSAIIVVSADWSALDGAGRAWLTADAGPLTEVTYERNASFGTSYSGYHADAGVGAAKSLGLSLPAAQKYSIVALEILGLPSQTARPDLDVTTTGWTATPLFSKINDSSDATIVTATAS